jgi:hypothetical protein
MAKLHELSAPFEAIKNALPAELRELLEATLRQYFSSRGARPDSIDWCVDYYKVHIYSIASAAGIIMPSAN